MIDPLLPEKKKDEEKSDEDNLLAMRNALGDTLGTGIPGGLDLDITTPL